MNIHLKIQELRKKAGLSQEGFAERLGVSRQAVSKWESGASTPDIEKIIAISKIFEISLSELLTGEKEEAPLSVEAPAEIAVSDEKYEELLQDHLLQIDEMLKKGKKKRLIWCIAIILVAVIVIFGYLTHHNKEMHALETNIKTLQSDMSAISNIRTDINHQIYSIRQEISDTLKKEYGMVSDFDIEYRDMSFPDRTVVLDIYASPRLWNNGDRISFIIESDGERLTVDGIYEDGTATATVTVPLTDNIQVSACIISGGTTVQERLDDIRSLLSLHLLDVDGHGSISSTHTEGSDSFTLEGSVSVFVSTKLYDENKSAKSQIKSLTLEFIENGKATQTVDMLELKPDFNAAEMCNFNYSVDTIERPLKAGDIYEFVVTLTDLNNVTYRGVLERIEIGYNLTIEHDKSYYGSFEAILP
ncbi:MAG: helix-turn-helix transcriptional regulator [Clostridia bacterium]|nr:helix-turn-helix transcriptional regulator [Clostridia bacterium]